MTEGIHYTHVVGPGLIMFLNIFCVEFKVSRCLENSTAGRFLYYLWYVGRLRSHIEAIEYIDVLAMVGEIRSVHMYNFNMIDEMSTVHIYRFNIIGEIPTVHIYNFNIIGEIPLCRRYKNNCINYIYFPGVDKDSLYSTICGTSEVYM